MRPMKFAIFGNTYQAKKPKRPVLMPNMGILRDPTRLAAFRKVPSPPMLSTISASKSFPSKTPA